MPHAFRLLLAVFLLGLTGCRTAHFYSQAVRGQYQILSRQQSCEELLKDPRTPPELKAKLVLVRQLRAFAEQELKLPVDGHYQHYADLGRPFVVWNVLAAPRFSLAAKTWWYPFVGSLSYRGYFSEADARQLAAQLSAKGFDTFVEGVEAYSTLGWFHDPILNTFLHHPEAELAEILFHELAHQRVFAAGDTDFNEAFATAVGQEGARRWLRARGASNELAQYEINVRREREFTVLVQQTRGRLESLYGDRRNERGELEAFQTPVSSPQLAVEKGRVLGSFRASLEGLRAEWRAPVALENWVAGQINNARLNSVAAYHDLVPGFERLHSECGGVLEQFYHESKRMAKLPKAERRAELLGGSPRLELRNRRPI